MKINKRTVICFGIFFVLLLMTTGNVAAAQEEGTRTRVISNGANQKCLDIQEDRIIWADDRNEKGQIDYWDMYFGRDGNWDIYMYNLSTSTETQITDNNSTQFNPAISGDRIVWQDNRNGNWDIYMYDLSTSMEIRVTANKSNQSEPAIYEDKIVWQDDRNGNLDIYLYDLSTSTETRITTNESNQSEPVIYGDKIVWVGEVPIDDPELVPYSYLSVYNAICVYNLSTSTETQFSPGVRMWNPSIHENRIVWIQEDSVGNNNMVLMDDLSTSMGALIAYERTSDPDIYEDRVVWVQNWDDRDQIFMYNLSTSTKTQITVPVHDKGAASSPAIYGDRIVWSNNGIDMFTIASAGTPANDSNMEAGTEMRITTDESQQCSPDISGDRIVWKDWRNGEGIDQSGYPAGNWDVYMYNLSTRNETQITYGSQDEESPAIYGDIIVWTGSDSIYNISTSNKTRITSGIAGCPSIYNDRIVWAYNDIYMYNFSTSTKTQVGTGTSYKEHPAIYGDRIVWTDNRNELWDEEGNSGKNLDIYMYDISTSTETRITTNNSTQRLPAIYKDRIVWEDDRNGNWDIYMYNISTSTESQITANELNQGFPAIYGDRIIWVDDRTGRRSIYMYNLSTSRETRITANGTVGSNLEPDELWLINGGGPSIYGDRIVWEDVRNGNGDIYMFTFDSAEVPPLDGNETEEDNGTEEEDNGTDNDTEVPDNCSSELKPLDSIKTLKEHVECTYKCHEKTRTGLASLLDSSMCYYEKGEDEKAISMLKSFIHLAERMKECKQISADEADYMVREAKKIIDKIEEN